LAAVSAQVLDQGRLDGSQFNLRIVDPGALAVPQA
jgi:hypothetical protein